jgi:hypothetical protein
VRKAWLGLVLVAGLTACSFDAKGLGAKAHEDAGPGQGSGSADAQPGGGGGGTPDAANGAGTPDAANASTPDAATDVGIVCGNLTCSTADVCCVALGGGGAKYECKDKCGGGQAQYECDGPEDCGNDQSCCFTQFSSTCAKSCGLGQDTACRTPSDCPSGGGGGGGDMCCPTQYPNIDLCRSFCI